MLQTKTRRGLCASAAAAAAHQDRGTGRPGRRSGSHSAPGSRNAVQPGGAAVPASLRDMHAEMPRPAGCKVAGADRVPGGVGPPDPGTVRHHRPPGRPRILQIRQPVQFLRSGSVQQELPVVPVELRERILQQQSGGADPSPASASAILFVALQVDIDLASFPPVGEPADPLEHRDGCTVSGGRTRREAVC